MAAVRGSMTEGKTKIMSKEAIGVAASSAASGVGTVNSIWLWLIADPAAHSMTILTGILVLSQLYWGWRKFIKESRS